MQYMGVHSCMFLTISYPPYIRGILDVAADLAGHPELGAFTWVYHLTCKTQQDDLWYFLPKSVWGFQEGEYDAVMKTYSTLPILQGKGGGMYYILNMPLITRKYLRARYKKPVGRRPKKPGIYTNLAPKS